MATNVTLDDIRQWCQATSGTFHIGSCATERKIAPEDRPKLRVAFSRLAKEGLIESVGGKDGYYRLISREWDDIDVFGESQFYDLWWPFPIHKVARVGRGGIVVVAGEKGKGKTGLLLNVAMKNSDKLDIWYFDSESGPDLLQERLFAMKPDLAPPLPFHLKRFEGQAEDMVMSNPDSITILDYIEEPDEAYKIAGTLKRISERLGKGLAIVALQKPPGRDFAYGGAQTQNKPQLYLSLSSSEDGYKKLKIVHAKSRPNPLVNPEGKEWTYKLINMGTQFSEINPPDWEYEEESAF